MSERQTGTVLWYDAAQGTGAISGADGTELTVSATALRSGGGLQPGQLVEYTPDEGRKSPAAEDVVPVDPSSGRM